MLCLVQRTCVMARRTWSEASGGRALSWRRLIILDMSEKDSRRGGGRKYPPLWEKLVPILVWVLAGIVVLLIVIVFAVALGLIPGAG